MSFEKKQLLSSENTDEDRILNLSLRPDKMEEFIGQNEVIENLKVSLVAARKRKESLDHLLFSGPPGLGKTSP